MEELVGKNVIIRTVTNYYTGRVASVDFAAKLVALDDAAWIADTGRFADALATGTLNEVEPYPGRVYVGLGAIVDVSEWAHELPRTQR